jgi:hypothetical protein
MQSRACELPPLKSRALVATPKIFVSIMQSMLGDEGGFFQGKSGFREVLSSWESAHISL